MEYKHYIRIDSQNRIIAAFSDAFQSPQDGDILYRESDERHFHLELHREDGFLRYEWDGKKIIERTELTTDETALLSEQQAKTALAESDQAMIRGIDDLVNLLIEKKIISKEEFPEEFIKKIKAREKLRVKS